MRLLLLCFLEVISLYFIIVPSTDAFTTTRSWKSTVQFEAAASSDSSSSSPSADMAEASKVEAERLKEQARKLREEIANFESAKDQMVETERKEIQAKLDKKQALVDRYSAIVPILKPDGTTVEEKVQFPPILGKRGADSVEEADTTIIVIEAPLPLGILLGEDETIPGMTVVDEVVDGSNGQTVGIQEGDMLRACTACQPTMAQPTWQLIAGGIGKPKTVRMMFDVDYKPFEQVMGAIASNRLDPEERSAILVIERKVQ